ncbi:hypothetical protein F5883DRAFT_687405, partial [Diaporthe sp. PMI_573]
MLSAGLPSTYRQYKCDTDVVASWLAATANQHGYTAPFAAPPTASAPANTSAAPSSGRLKGKARKVARQQLQQQVAPSSVDTKDAPEPPPKSKYVLAIRDFVPLAEFIASKLATTTPTAPENEVGIPSFFSTALERAIRVRKALSARLNAVKQHPSAQADATHAHFVGVLEKVCDILLKPEGSSGDAFNIAAMKDATNAVRADTEKKDKARDFNIFDVLQVYEPSEEFLNAPDVVLPAASSPVELEYTAEEDYSEAECVFAFTALLKDLMNLREEVSNLWNEYRSGKIDLAAAAVGANMAIELARGMEEDMAPLLKKHDGALVLLPKFFGAICQTMGLDPFHKELFTDDMNFACYDMGATFLYNAASLLEAIRTAAPHSARGMPSYTGKFGWYDAQTAHLETMDNRQRWAQDKAALLEVVPDITLLFELKGIPVLDEFARGVKAMLETQEIPVWLCFAAQNYLDTLHFFGPDVTRPLAEFHHFNEITVELLDRAKVAERNIVVKKDLEDMRRMVTVQMNGVDIFTASRMVSNRGSRNESASRPSSFLQHNPLFCGLWIHYARVLFHQTGVKYAAKPGAVLHAVQLYTVVRQQQQQKNSVSVPEWPDIDRLLAMQGPQAFFVGTEPPASPRAHFQNYCMSRAVSPANWLAATNRRKGKQGKVPVQTSRAGIRELKFRAPASLWCGARVEKRETAEPTRRIWNAEVVQQILEVSGWLKKQEQEQTKKDGTAETETQAGAAAVGKAKAKATPAPPTLTAQELVHHVAHAIQAEIPDLVFNYFAMHETACGLLEQVQAHADDIGLPRMSYVTSDVADLAGLILATAAGELASVSGQGQRVLGEVARRIEEYVTAELDGCLVALGRIAHVLTTDKRALTA